MRLPQTRKIMFLLLSATLMCVLIASGCGKKETSPIPPAGTRAATKAGKSDVFRQTARNIQNECEQMGGCTCFLDGVQTTCGVVFACLDAGFCELVRAS